MVNTVIDALGKIGLSSQEFLLIILTTFLFIWLYKQVLGYKDKQVEKEKNYLVDTLTTYSSLYKACLCYKGNQLSKEELLTSLIDSIHYIDKEMYLSLEEAILKDQPLEDNITKIKQQVVDLKDRARDYTDIVDRRTVSGSILSRINLIEEVFSPIFLTMLLFVVMIIFIVIGLLPVFGLWLEFLNKLVIIFLVVGLLSVVALILDKKFNYSKVSIGLLVAYLVLTVLFIWINSIYALAAAIVLFLIFAWVNPKYMKKSSISSEK